MHLVRNAVDHGLELPEVRDRRRQARRGRDPALAHRIAATRSRSASPTTAAASIPTGSSARAVEKGVITRDEADAMDERAARDLIFRAGFSTAATVSEVSGRGVGMDVVRQTIVTRLKGTIDVESTVGQGSAFVLKLPLTLAIIQVIVARAGGETFAIPLDIVQRVLAIKPSEVELIGDREVCVVRGKHVPLIRLEQRARARRWRRRRPSCSSCSSSTAARPTRSCAITCSASARS